MDQMLTISQVKEKLQVGYKTVSNAISSGKLVAAKIGNEWRIDPDELAAFVKRRSTTARKR